MQIIVTIITGTVTLNIIVNNVWSIIAVWKSVTGIKYADTVGLKGVLVMCINVGVGS